MIVAHRHRLAEGFSEAARRGEAAGGGGGAASGRVTVEQWAAVMSKELHLSVDWLALQPSLVPTVQRAAVGADGAVTLRDTGLIDATRFLEGYAAELAKVRAGGGARGSGGASDAKMAEVLVTNHAQLLVIFRYEQPPPHISPHLPTSPHISPHLPTSPPSGMSSHLQP